MLLYTDIAMQSFTLALAAGPRLAPAQVLVLNNGQTSGLAATMDWYLSSYLEQPNNEEAVPLHSEAPVMHRSLDTSGGGEVCKSPACTRLSTAIAAGVVVPASDVASGLAGEDRRAAAQHYTERLYLFGGDIGISYVHAAWLWHLCA